MGDAPGTATAFAPATVANVAVGFDILGFALAVPGLGDEVTVRRTPEPGVRLAAPATAGGVALPGEARSNTATAGLLRMQAELRLPFGFEVTVRKGIPMGSGLGGSAASAAASVAAACLVLKEAGIADPPLASRLAWVLEGERAASGALHGDNVFPAYLGGLQLVVGVDPPECQYLPVPAELWCAAALPDIAVETRSARAMLNREVPLGAFVVQGARLAGFVRALHVADFGLMGRTLVDGVIEPQRARLIPGFGHVQAAARVAGALGCSISGSGPAVFALCEGQARARAVAEVMRGVFAASGVKARAFESPVGGPGAITGAKALR